MSVISSAKVIEIIPHGEDVKEFILHLTVYHNFEAGQFLQLTLEEVSASGIWPDSRTFSIASYTNKDHTIRLVIKRTGKYTSRIFNDLQVGKVCYIKYAYGDFLLPLFDNDSAIHCIAGGTGVAPFLSFMESLINDGQINRMFLYHSVRFEAEFINYQGIASSMPEKQRQFFCTRQDSALGFCRHIRIEDILNNVTNIGDEHFYICGSKEFISYFKDSLSSHGAVNIYLDEWE